MCAEKVDQSDEGLFFVLEAQNVIDAFLYAFSYAIWRSVFSLRRINSVLYLLEEWTNWLSVN